MHKIVNSQQTRLFDLTAHGIHGAASPQPKEYICVCMFPVPRIPSGFGVCVFGFLGYQQAEWKLGQTSDGSPKGLNAFILHLTAKAL